jgi:hypothetical protein
MILHDIPDALRRDALPPALLDGENWGLLTIDPRWVWLAKDEEGDVVGFLMACDCHGLAIVWRVKMLPGAPPWTLGRLLRSFIRDLRRRGILGYATFLDMTRAEEQALMRIMYRAGAKFSYATTLLCGSVATRHVAGEDR